MPPELTMNYDADSLAQIAILPDEVQKALDQMATAKQQLCNIGYNLDSIGEDFSETLKELAMDGRSTG